MRDIKKVNRAVFPSLMRRVGVHPIEECDLFLGALFQ
jgi:hypothetical protein